MKKKVRMKYTGLDKQIKKIYDSKKALRCISFIDFRLWYLEQGEKCIYCGLTSEETLILFNKFPLSTRGGKRGRRLELDRIDPHLSYGHSLSNLALACYWCNNAKTNYFDFEEFQCIGNAIGQINHARLIKIKNNEK
jgi:hypothetical protein